MTKPKANPLPDLLQGFFQHLIKERQLSPCTVSSYQDTFRLLISFGDSRAPNGCELRLEDWDAPSILVFLEHLEKQRQCCARTRNTRLAAIHSFMRYVSRRQPMFIGLADRVLAIPNKRYHRPLVGFLTSQEMEALVGAPDPTTLSGQRDRLLLQLLYNTGARVSEIVALNRQDVTLGTSRTVALHGKGRKERLVPLWSKTAQQLRQWLEPLPSDPLTPVFTNRFGFRLTRFGIQKRLAQAARTAARVCPSLRGRKISPHILRHTTAMHLLQAGVDITAIALWLGHESPNTTHHYIQADLEMKKKTLKRLQPPNTKPATFKPRNALLAVLQSL